MSSLNLISNKKDKNNHDNIVVIKQCFVGVEYKRVFVATYVNQEVQKWRRFDMVCVGGLQASSVKMTY